jgi:hypothetical protein
MGGTEKGEKGASVRYSKRFSHGTGRNSMFSMDYRVSTAIDRARHQNGKSRSFGLYER